MGLDAPKGYILRVYSVGLLSQQTKQGEKKWKSYFIDSSYHMIATDDDKALILGKLAVKVVNPVTGINLMKFNWCRDGTINFWWSSFEDPDNHRLSSLGKKFFKELRLLGTE
ncbi:MAG: hypothetical protein ACFFDH_13545 [Promethearchaeota archaeon]